ncbi:hypothetical protein DLD82_00405 [Methanospirillum stamsii]|uniref:Uncharacterized protein n=2 Tax=Methanospirillum stamsii TaxID=1277351 RepID=A0A2V2NFH1_9EURY|nr:hypothetical protein DLD82_00405 [Methanospirillum stamsii]
MVNQMKNVCHEIRIIQHPVFLGEREIYPVVRTTVWSLENGFFLSGNPLALIIKEKENWFFVSMDQDIPDIFTLLSVMKKEK